ncbi:MAG: flavin reductase family protein [Candidatus Melainabacteria bacterium]|nr:MAG: flavin reductase family protein [Candidatus Melainabacteria bacterium]
MLIDAGKASPNDMYRILLGSVLPRPIAWVSTRSNSGIDNLAPFSFFNAVSARPPLLAFAPALQAVAEPDSNKGVPKDTLRNIKENGEFVINIVSHSLRDQMNASSGNFNSDISEFDETKLTRVASSMVKPFRVGECKISFECTLYKLLEFGEEPSSGNLVIGSVLCVHLDDSIYKDGHIDTNKLDPIARMEGNWYCTIRDRFKMERPT